MGRPSRPRPSGPLVWVHAASVGEAQSALILIDALARSVNSVNVLVTTGTVTSAELMGKRLPAFAFHQFVPVDNPDWVRAFLDHWKPDLALWMESELWPNMLTALKDRGVPLALINARLSDKSFANWSMARGFAAQIIGCFSLILAQTDKDAAHYRALGASNVVVTDNIKYSAAPLPHDADALAALKLAVADRPVWVYASTHAGEESLACRVHTSIKERIPNLLTVIVPRHPERREAVADACFEEGVKFRLRSNNNALPVMDDDVYIADTLGELGLFYTLCPVAMIGRSFSDDGGGGHNPVEAAQLGCAVLTGPHNQYQRQIYDDMQEFAAVMEAKDEMEFAAILEELLTNPSKLHSQQNKAAAFVDRKTHVVDVVLKELTPLLQRTEKKHAA
jgi:3-deoxy-D-manno-octulosonic-acid transferase